MHVTAADIRQTAVLMECGASVVLVLRKGLVSRRVVQLLDRLLSTVDVIAVDAPPLISVRSDRNA